MLLHKLSRSVLGGILLLLTAISLFLGLRYLNTSYDFHLPLEGSHYDQKPLLKQGNTTFFEMAPKYISAIMNTEDSSFPRLKCPAPDANRYEYLKSNATDSTQKNYFFALDLHDSAKLLPRLLGSIVEAMNFLGPENCALSIVEGRSVDGTFEVLAELQSAIEYIGATYFFTTNEIHPKAEGQDRIQLLAELRNLALEPLRQDPSKYAPNSTVVFINDVAICMEDILELIHQRVRQNADMVCAMDWTYVGRDPTFYDVWIARDIKGDSFFDIPSAGDWNSAWNLFWNNQDTLSRYRAHKPFQVFSCWNGATAFTAAPILEDRIRFRRSPEGKCYKGEPELFCEDLWSIGSGKIAVVPSVNIEYSDERGQQIKDLKGYVSDNIVGEDQSVLISWEANPPPLVKCLESYPGTWLPWSETLA